MTEIESTNAVLNVDPQFSADDLEKKHEEEIRAINDSYKKQIDDLTKKIADLESLNTGLQRALVRNATLPSQPEKTKAEQEKEAYDAGVQSIAKKILSRID